MRWNPNRGRACASSRIRVRNGVWSRAVLRLYHPLRLKSANAHARTVLTRNTS